MNLLSYLILVLALIASRSFCFPQTSFATKLIGMAALEAKFPTETFARKLQVVSPARKKRGRTPRAPPSPTANPIESPVVPGPKPPPGSFPPLPAPFPPPPPCHH